MTDTTPARDTWGTSMASWDLLVTGGARRIRLHLADPSRTAVTFHVNERNEPLLSHGGAHGWVTIERDQPTKVPSEILDAYERGMIRGAEMQAEADGRGMSVGDDIASDMEEMRK